MAGIVTVTWAASAAHGRLAEVAELYVRPAARRRGVATALLEAAIAWARDQGCTVCRLAVGPDGELSHGVAGFFTAPRVRRRLSQGPRARGARRRPTRSEPARRLRRRRGRGGAVTPLAGPPREEGFSKDADKLIRRLSLVALLLSRHGRPATTAEIRQRVEGYALMTDDAFKRRFYEDRSELAGLGIGIVGDADGEGAGEMYCLPAAAYYLPAIELTADELSALAACLFVLEHRFAYASRCGWRCSASPTGGRSCSPRAAAPVTVLPRARGAARGRRPAQAAAGRRGRQDRGLHLLLDRPRRGASAHGRPLRPAAGRRRVVPDRATVTCARRSAPSACRACARGYASPPARPHDFSPPARFTIDDYLDRPPWQLGEPVGQATVRVTRRHGLVGGRPTSLAAARSSPATTADGGDGARRSAATPTGAASSARRLDSRRQLGLGAVHGRGGRGARAGGAARRAAGAARAARRRLAHPPSRRRSRCRPTRPRRRRPSRARRRVRPRAAPAPTWQVEADRFTRLATLMTYLHGVCRAAGGGDETPVPVTDVCAALDTTPAELRADVRLLNLVNFGGEGTLVWAEIKGATLVVTCDVASSAFARPARLSPLQVDTLLLAVEILGGQLPIEHGAALRSAAEKLRRARRAAPSAVAAGERLPTAEPILDAVNAAIGDHRLLDIEYWSEGSGDDHDAHRRALPAGAHARRVVLRRLVPALAWHAHLPRGHHQARGCCAASTSCRAPRSRSSSTAARACAARSATRRGARSVWYGPDVARWVAEREPTAAAPGGACLALQPYVDERWLTHELLRFGGEALPLAPPTPWRPCAGSSSGCSSGTLSAMHLSTIVVQILFAVQLPVCLYVGRAHGPAHRAAVLNWLVCGLARRHRLPAARRPDRARRLPRLPAGAARPRGGVTAPAAPDPALDGAAVGAPYVFSGRRCLTVGGDRASSRRRTACAEPRRSGRRPSPRRSTNRWARRRSRELAAGARDVAIAVPDASRDCPVAALLPPLLERLALAGAARRCRSRVVVGCGLHRTTTAGREGGARGRRGGRPAACRRRPGHEPDERAARQHAAGGAHLHERRGRARPTSSSPWASSSRTSTPASRAASRRWRSAAPARRRSPGHTTRSSSTSPACGSAGSTATPSRRRCARSPRATALRFAVNVVMNDGGGVAGVAAGDPAAVQRPLAADHGAGLDQALRAALRPRLAGVRPPRTRASTRRRARRPTWACRPARWWPGGLIVCCADLPLGVGDGPGETNFGALLAATGAPLDLVARGCVEPLGPGGQRAYMMAKLMTPLPRRRGRRAATALSSRASGCWPSAASTRRSPRSPRAGAEARVLALADGSTRGRARGLGARQARRRDATASELGGLAVRPPRTRGTTGKSDPTRRSMGSGFKIARLFGIDIAITPSWFIIFVFVPGRWPRRCSDRALVDGHALDRGRGRGAAALRLGARPRARPFARGPRPGHPGARHHPVDAGRRLDHRVRSRRARAARRCSPGSGPLSSLVHRRGVLASARARCPDLEHRPRRARLPRLHQHAPGRLQHAAGVSPRRQQGAPRRTVGVTHDVLKATALGGPRRPRDRLRHDRRSACFAARAAHRPRRLRRRHLARASSAGSWCRPRRWPAARAAPRAAWPACTVGSLMSLPPTWIPGDITLRKAANDYFLALNARCLPVQDDDGTSRG